jgi:hypothetical protein
VGSVTGGADVQEVAGEFSYLAAESTVLRRFTAPGESVNTGAYRAYEMPVRNGRPVRDQFTLDRNGFAIIGHASSVADFTDREEVNRVYVGEVAEFVKSYTGADGVATLGWTLRRSVAPGENASQPQAALVHDDFSVAMHGPGVFRTAHSTIEPHGRPDRGTASNSAPSPTSHSGMAKTFN